MSYDLTAWFTKLPDFDQLVAEFPGAERDGGQITLSFPNSQISIFGPHDCEPEDVPVEILAVNPLVRHQIEISVEPISAPEKVKSKAIKLIKMLCESGGGTALDQQTDMIYGRKKRVPFAPVKEETAVAELELSWWFRAPILRTHDGWQSLLALFDQFLPEALPRRYGEYEPPKFKLATEGREHFIDFVTKQEMSTVIYPELPVTGMSCSLPVPPGPNWQGYRVNYFHVDLLASTMEEPTRQKAVKQLWKAVSLLLQPFYGDVRVLGNRTMNRKRIWYTGGSVQHPIKSWWWRGLPPSLGIATVIGEPYLSMWPEFAGKAEHWGALAYMSNGDWMETSDITRKTGEVPKSMAKRGTRSVRLGNSLVENDFHGRLSSEDEVWIFYPEKWPFEFPVILSQ